MSVKLISNYAHVNVRLRFQLADDGGSKYLKIKYEKCIVDRRSNKQPNISVCKQATATSLNYYTDYYRSFYNLKPEQEYYFSVYLTSRAGQVGPTRAIYYVAPKLRRKY